MRHWWKAKKAEKKADQELAKSQALLEETRRKIQPMEAIYEHNRFALIIKDALGIGWGDDQAGRGPAHGNRAGC